MEAALNEIKHLKLKLTNPARNKNIEYKFLENPDIGSIILDVIRLAREQYPQLDCLLSETVLRRYDITKHKSLNTLCAYFNRSIRHLFYNVSYPLENTVNKALLKKIFNIVVKEKNLPKDTFNDKNFESVCNIFESLNLMENDSICNIGTGIGDIILQLASYMTPCSKIVSLMENCTPEHSKTFHIHFQQYADWFGKKNKKIHFIRPDCFSEMKINQISMYSVLFIGDSILEREILLNMISLLNENTKIYSTSLILEMNDSQGLECRTSLNEHYPYIYKKRHIETPKLLGDSLINCKTEIRKLMLKHNLEEEDDLQKNSRDLSVKESENNIECINNVSSPLKIFAEDLNNVELSDNFIGVQTRRAWAEWCRNKEDFQVNNINKNSDLDRRIKQNNSFSRKHKFKKSQISRSKLARTRKFKDNLKNCNFIMEDVDEEPRISGIPIDVYEKMYTVLYKKVEFFSIKCPTFLFKGHGEQFNESCFNSSNVGTNLD